MKVLIRLDPKTGKLLDEVYWPESRPIPPIIPPPDEEEPKDGGIVKDKPGTFNNEKPN